MSKYVAPPFLCFSVSPVSPCIPVAYPCASTFILSSVLIILFWAATCVFFLLCVSPTRPGAHHTRVHIALPAACTCLLFLRSTCVSLF